MVLLLEQAKLVVEGAGAVGVAALLRRRSRRRREGTTVVDPLAAATSTRRCWRAARAATRRWPGGGSSSSPVPDRPGSLAGLLAVVGGAGANLVEVEHVREGVALHVRETGVQLVLETRGREHAEDVLAAVRAAGYEARVVR